MKKLSLPQIIPISRQETNFLIEQNVGKNLSTLQLKHSEIKIVYFGTPEFSAYILERLIESSQNPPQSLGVHLKGGELNQPKLIIQAVVTAPDKPVGRKQILTASPVSLVAQKYSIPVLKPEKLDHDFISSHFSFITSHLFIVASYGQIFPQALLDIPTLGSINVHGSILPKYRGASPIQAAILNGDQQTGVTMMLMDAQVDHGPILTQQKIAISGIDTYLSLSNKIAQIAAPLLIETLIQFVSGKIKPRAQNHARASFCKLVTKENGYFNINHPPTPDKLDRMIRAYYPWPTTWTKWQGRVVKLLPNQMVQIEGKKLVKLADFLNGYPDFPLAF